MAAIFKNLRIHHMSWIVQQVSILPSASEFHDIVSGQKILVLPPLSLQRELDSTAKYRTGGKNAWFWIACL